MSEKNLQMVLSSPGQKLAKFLHTIKTKFRSEKVAEIRPLEPYITEGAVIFDIGAHFGQYAKVFAKLNKSSVKVYCFEPVNYTRDILSAVLEKHPNTIIFSNGFSNKSGILNINIPIKKSGKIGPGIASICEERERDYVVQKAHIDTIDNFMKQHNVNRLDFIKIDIEGPEYLVFKGAIKTLQKFKPTIYCEVVAEQMLKLDIKTDELFNFMTNLGYQSYVFQKGTLTKTEGYIAPADYLFLHKDKAGAQ